MPLRPACLAAFLALALCAGPRPATAQPAPAQPVAFARAQHLRHGINASEWFSQTGNYSAARINSYIDARDIALMAKMGFDHVRLGVDPLPLAQSLNGGNPGFLAALDRAVDTMLANGLAVQICIFPDDNYKQQLRAGNDAVDRFVMLWRKLAAHFADRNPNLLFFEIVNEPEIYDPYRWAGIQQRLAEAIRAAAPQFTIVATGANYSDISDLVNLDPLAGGNVIYNFHFYDPHQFTHQGATWGTPWWMYTHSIPYPPTDASMQTLLQQVPDAAARYQLENYWLDHWDAQHIRALIDEAAAWARDRDLPLMCDEFGVFRDHADPASRANWIRDVRTALEADGIGWAMWDYRGGFGVVHKQDGQPAQVDNDVLDALGLKER